MRFILATILALLTTAANSQQFFLTHYGAATLDLGSPDAGEYPFLNQIKGALNESGTGAWPAQLSGATSYPTGTLSQNITFNITSLPTTAETGGSWNWIIEWPKQGAVDQIATVSISRTGHTFTTVSQSSSCTITGSGTATYTVGGTDCRVIYTDTGTGGLAYAFTFPSGDTYTGFTNLILVRSDQETELLAGSGTDCDSTSGICFYPDFLGTLSSKNWTAPSGVSLNPKALRFLNWNLAVDQNATNNVTALSQLQTTASLAWAPPFYFNESEWVGDLCAQTQTGGCSGVGSGSTNVYGAAALGGVTSCASMGTTYQFQALAIDASTSTATLTVGTCTAPLVNTSAAAIGSGTIAANVVQTVSYDPLLNKYIVQAQGIRAGVPIAVMVSLCNVLNMDCWINIPTMIDYVGPSSAVGQIATYIAQNLKSTLRWKIEYSNEVFNFAAPPTNWFTARGVVQGFPSGNNRQTFDPYMAQRQVVMQTAATAWVAAGRSLSQLDEVATVQSVANNTQIETYQFKGTDLTLDSSGNYTTGTGGGCSGAGSGLPVVTNYSFQTVCGTPSTGDPVSTTITIFGYAPYWNGAQIVGETISSACAQATNSFGCWNNDMSGALLAADEYASGTPSLIAAALQFVDADLRAGTRSVGGAAAVLGVETLSNFTTTYFAQWDCLVTRYSTTLFAKYGLPGGCSSFVGGSLVGVEQYEGGVQINPPSGATLTTLASYTNPFQTNYSGGAISAGGTQTCASNNATNCATELATLVTAYRNSGLAQQFVTDSFNDFMSYKSSLMPAYYDLGPDSSQWPLIPAPDIYATPYLTYAGFALFSALP